MKRICAAALILCCAFFTGCKSAESYESITGRYAGKTVSCTARIIAPGEYGGEFTVSFTSTPEGDEAEILSPGSVAGVKAEIRDGGALLSYAGKSLETPFAAYRETAPASCLSAVFESIRSGAPGVWSKNERRLDYTNGDVTQTLYFDEEGALSAASLNVLRIALTNSSFGRSLRQIKTGSFEAVMSVFAISVLPTPGSP